MQRKKGGLCRYHTMVYPPIMPYFYFSADFGKTPTLEFNSVGFKRGELHTFYFNDDFSWSHTKRRKGGFTTHPSFCMKMIEATKTPFLCKMTQMWNNWPINCMIVVKQVKCCSLLLPRAASSLYGHSLHAKLSMPSLYTKMECLIWVFLSVYFWMSS